MEGLGWGGEVRGRAAAWRGPPPPADAPSRGRPLGPAQGGSTECGWRSPRRLQGAPGLAGWGAGLSGRPPRPPPTPPPRPRPSALFTSFLLSPGAKPVIPKNILTQ